MDTHRPFEFTLNISRLTPDTHRISFPNRVASEFSGRCGKNFRVEYARERIGQGFERIERTMTSKYRNNMYSDVTENL